MPFNDWLVNPLVIGILQGAVYGLVALGLVLVYKGNRVFNFAQGEFGSVAAFITYAFTAGARFLPEVPYAVAVLLGLIAGTLTGYLTERLVIRPLFRQPKVTIVVATAGVGLFLIALELLFNGANIKNLAPIASGPAVTIGDFAVSKQQVIFLLVLGVFAVLAALFFNRTMTGLAILAVSQEPTATSLAGINVRRISGLTWAMAGFLGAVAGILFAPISPFGPGFLTTGVLIPSFTAAVLGGMTSLPGAFVGGIAIGVVEQYGLKLTSTFPGANRVAVFTVLLLVLIVRPSGLLGKEA